MDDISEKCRTDINTDSKYTYYPSFRILLHSFSFSERWVQGQLKLLSPPLARHRQDIGVLASPETETVV